MLCSFVVVPGTGEADELILSRLEYSLLCLNLGHCCSQMSASVGFIAKGSDGKLLMDPEGEILNTS